MVIDENDSAEPLTVPTRAAVVVVVLERAHVAEAASVTCSELRETSDDASADPAGR